MTLLFIIAGCSSSDTSTAEEKDTSGGEAVDDDKATGPTANLKEKPTSYCVTYFNTIAVAGAVQQMEYCRDENNAMGMTEQFGSQVQMFCLDGKGSTCSGDASHKDCFESVQICGTLREPFAEVQLPSGGEFYEKAAGRSIAGLQAQCYRLDIGRAGGMIGQDIPEALRYAHLCYHPWFNMLVYYDFNDITTEVKTLVTPAAAEKFVLPK